MARGRSRFLAGCAVLWVLTGCVPVGEPQGSVDVPLPVTGGPTSSDSVTIAGSHTPLAACEGSGPPMGAVHREMFLAVNAYRQQNGRSALRYSRTLEAAANAHAQDLYVRDFFDHTNPDGLGPGDRALQAGFCHDRVGENIAAGQTSVSEVQEGWERSPGHKANMLYPYYEWAGMGHYVSPDGRHYWVQVFALPNE